MYMYSRYSLLGVRVFAVSVSVVSGAGVVFVFLRLLYRAGFKLGGHIFEKGIFSVLYKHKLPRIFIGFSKVLKYVNF